MTEELMHHGIKGQRWGVRRTPAELGHVIGARKKEDSGDTAGASIKDRISAAAQSWQAKRAAKTAQKEPEKKAKKLDKKGVEKMTDDELRERINRLRMEEQYSDLMKKLNKKDPNH